MSRRIKLGPKIKLGFALLLLIAVLQGGLAAWSMNGVSHAVQGVAAASLGVAPDDDARGPVDRADGGHRDGRLQHGVQLSGEAAGCTRKSVPSPRATSCTPYAANRQSLFAKCCR